MEWNSMNKIKLIVCSIFLMGITACTTEILETGSVVENRLQLILDNYFSEETELNSNAAIFKGDYRYNHIWVNNLTDEHIKSSHDLNERYLIAIKKINRAELNTEEQISYDIFLWDRETDKASEQFPWELLPINQFTSLPSFFAQLGSGESAQPFKTVKDYEDFLKRTDGFLDWMNSARLRMGQGIEKGMVQPEALMTKLVPQLQAMVVDDHTNSIFWKPIKNIPKSFSDDDKKRLAKLYADKIKNKLIPAYQQLQQFVEKTYLPATRQSSGFSALPGGADWYQWLIQYHTTTTDLAAEDIHNIGIKEVARIHQEMSQIKQQVEFEGDLQQFFKHLQTDEQFYFKTNQQVFDRYRLEREIVEKVIPKFFDVTPKTAFEIRPIEEFRAESSAGASYQAGTPDGSRPGIFYINTFNLKAQPIFGVETLYLHEAIPGHHFQISLAQEETSLPDYRKFVDYNAFSEGWALYVESIGKEMGLFRDPYQY